MRPPLRAVSSAGQSACFTRRRSLVRAQHRPLESPGNAAFCYSEPHRWHRLYTPKPVRSSALGSSSLAAAPAGQRGRATPRIRRPDRRAVHEVNRRGRLDSGDDPSRRVYDVRSSARPRSGSARPHGLRCTDALAQTDGGRHHLPVAKDGSAGASCRRADGRGMRATVTSRMVTVTNSRGRTLFSRKQPRVSPGSFYDDPKAVHSETHHGINCRWSKANGGAGGMRAHRRARFPDPDRTARSSGDQRCRPRGLPSQTAVAPPHRC